MTEPSDSGGPQEAPMTGQGDGQQGEQAHEWGEAVPASSGRPKPGDIITDPAWP